MLKKNHKVYQIKHKKSVFINSDLLVPLSKMNGIKIFCSIDEVKTLLNPSALEGRDAAWDG